MNASGVAGRITGNGITVNLNAATTTGGLAQSGSIIDFNGSTLATTATTTGNSAGQIGLRAFGSGSTINATGSSITLGPPNGTTTANNLVGGTAESGGILAFSNATIRSLGGVNGIANYGLVATDGQISFMGGSISTIARGSFGVFAQGGGVVTLGNGAQVTTTGVQTLGTLIGSHAAYATGTGSQIDGTNITLNTSGLLASGARAENGGAISLTNSTVNSSSNASADSDPSSAARALSGGSLSLTGVTINATGQRGVGFSVQDAGSVANVLNSNITVGGTRAPAAFIFNGGQATVTNSTLLSTANTGVLVQDPGSSINLINSTISSNAAVGYGLRSILGATTTMSGGAITTTGRDGPGFSAGIGGTIIGNNVTITTSGSDNAMGALADLAGTITLNGGSITTFGNTTRVASFPHGLTARNPGGVLTANGTTVQTFGSVAMGAVADDGGTVFLNGNSITTAGAGSIGLYSTVEQAGTQFPAAITANGVRVDTSGLAAHGAMAGQHFLIAPSVTTLNDSSVTTHGDLAAGLRAITAGTVNSDRTTVFTEGAGSVGLHSRDNGSSVNLDLTSILATGTSAHGALAESGGLVNGTNSTVRTTGANASALYVAGAPGFVSVANFNSSTLTNVSGPTISVGGNGNITLTNSSASGSGQWLRVGTINDFPPLTAPDPGPPGPTDPEGLEASPTFPAPGALPVVPGLANILLSGSTVTGSAFTAAGSVSNVVLANNSLWNLTGDSNLTNLTNDPSLIQFSPPVGGIFKTLTVVNYIGEGGIIGLNTFLGTDGSPSDKLVIDGGAATGNSGLKITNTTGPGALTKGNGILVVDAINGGTTVPAAFSLTGPVVAGPFEYTLHRSSVDTSNPQAWYLRSNLDCSVPGAPSPPCPPSPSPPVPNYRIETSLYAAIPSMTLLYGRTLLDTLHERVGEEEDVRGRTDLHTSTPKTGGWARLIGMHGQRDGASLGIYGEGPRYQYDFVGLQAGQDIYRKEKTDGTRDHAGLYFAMGGAHGRVSHFLGGSGSSDFQGYSIGGYWTHFGSKGWYLDAILQATWYDVTSGANRGISALTTSGFGIAGSLEGGYPIRFDKGYFIEPQLQGVFQHVGLNDGRDVGATVSFSDINSLAGRFGLRMGRTWLLDPSRDLRQMTAWIRPNLGHEFRGKPQTQFSSADGPVPFVSGLRGSWFELNAGLSGQISKEMSLFANVSYEWGLTQGGTAYTGKLGLRINM